MNRYGLYKADKKTLKGEEGMGCCLKDKLMRAMLEILGLVFMCLSFMLKIIRLILGMYLNGEMYVSY